MLSLLMLFLVASVGLSSPRPFELPDISPLFPEQVSSYAPFTNFAGAAYCNSSQILSWSCGAHCDANPSFKLFDSGGDGNVIPRWFVGYDPDRDTAIVVHQGTNIHRILSILTDLKVKFTHLNSTLFPAVPSSVAVHTGFAKDQAQTALQVLSAVQDVINTSGTSTVTTVGHSMGAALSLLDSIYLRLQLPADISVRAILYALPRVGNQGWADFVDALLPGNVTHINNKRDPVPILPMRFQGYHHPSGEIHIDVTSDAWESCPGQDNPSKLCIVGTVKSLIFGKVQDHYGPYDGIRTPCNPLDSST
ncbi:lipase [Lactarius quietus]|nr:lipase [Lactarius quietus]